MIINKKEEKMNHISVVDGYLNKLPKRLGFDPTSVVGRNVCRYILEHIASYEADLLEEGKEIEFWCVAADYEATCQEKINTALNLKDGVTEEKLYLHLRPPRVNTFYHVVLGVKQIKNNVVSN